MGPSLDSSRIMRLAVSHSRCAMLARSTAPQCGAATFMAIHYDRYHCGRCGLTLVFKDKEDKE
jgi:ribosomal protein S27AE